MSPEPWGEFLWEAEEGPELIEIGFDWLRADDTDLLQLLYKMGDDPTISTEPEESYRIVAEHSRRLVTNHWAEIEAVARALGEHDTLDGPEAVRIIEQTTGERYDLRVLYDLATLRSRFSV